MQKSTRFNVGYALVAIIGVIVLHDLWVRYQAVAPLPYSEFQALVRDGRVSEVVVTANEIRGEIENPAPDEKKYFRTTRVDKDLAELLGKHGVKFSGKKVSIIPRGIGALGYTIQRPTEDRYLMTREELENRMAVLMGGRAAEHVVFEHFSTGAADDLP